MKQSLQRFGGDWTAEKLERVRKYLAAYATIMHKQKFRFAYIDAFAGTGYRTLRQMKDQSELLIPELAEQESQSFLDGSARIALRVTPRFDRYIFIERDPNRFAELDRLKGGISDGCERRSSCQRGSECLSARPLSKSKVEESPSGPLS